MKLVRHGTLGAERPGLIDAEGSLRDLSSQLPDVSGNALAPSSLERLRGIDHRKLPRLPADSRLGACVGGVGKFVCVGLNYLDHVRESGAATPTEPVLFMKATSCISGPCDPIVVPPGAEKVDWEVELGVVIGTVAKNVAAEDALKHIAGYCVVNDVSERAWQLEGTGQWIKGKSADTFGPIGPCMVTGDEVGDPQRLKLWLAVNGQLRQHSNTEQMIFPVNVLISYISAFMTLHPGDIVSTGTPPGVALGAKPPVYLKRGDIVTLGVEGLGEQRQRVQ